MAHETKWTLNSFVYGAGCWASPIDCWNINQELNRLNAKAATGEPLTTSETEWATGKGEELQTDVDVQADKIRDKVKFGTDRLIWTVALVAGAVLLIKLR